MQVYFFIIRCVWWLFDSIWLFDRLFDACLWLFDLTYLRLFDAYLMTILAELFGLLDDHLMMISLPATVPAPQARALPSGTTAPQRRRQQPIPLRLRRGLPEPPDPYGAAAAFRKHQAACYGTAAAIPAMSYSLALHYPASCLCSGDSASRGGDADGAAYRRIQRRLIVKLQCQQRYIVNWGALPPPPSFLCMNQPGNRVSFGTPLTFKSFYKTTVSYKITWSLNRTFTTIA